MSENTEQINSNNSQLNKKAKKKSSQKTSLARIAIRLYWSLAIICLVATFGWFTINTLVFVENETPGNIQVTVSAGDLWIAQSLEDFDSEDYEDHAQLLEINRQLGSYIDVSGDGSHLYYPKDIITNSNNEDVVNLASSDNFDDVTGNTGFYIELRVYFRTSSQMDVYLTKDSYVKSVENNITNSGNVYSFARQSLLGAFSCDGIIGGARVAFLESDMQEEETLTLKSVWIPNDDILLTYNASRTSATLQTGVATNLRESRTTGYQYLYKNGLLMEERTYTAWDYATGNVLVTSSDSIERILANPTTGVANQATPLLSFDKSSSPQTKLLVIRLWFEGTDNETDRAFDGGMAKYNFNFCGLDKKSVDEAEGSYLLATQQDVDNRLIPSGKVGVYYNTHLRKLCIFEAQKTFDQGDATPIDGTNYMLYSLDGIEWNQYTDSTCQVVLEPLRAAGSYTLYIRTKETRSVAPGNVVAITVPAATN